MTEVRPGDFCCVPIGGTAGKLIELGEWLNGDSFAQYQHAAIYTGMVDAKNPYGFLFAAHPKGASYTRLNVMPEKIPGSIWSSGVINLTDNQRSSILKGCEELKGIPYSWEDYYALALHRFHIPAPYLKHYISSSKHMICSQLVDYVYNVYADVHLFTDNRWPGYVTPASLAQVIEDAPKRN